MATVQALQQGRLVLDNVSWQTYRRLLQALDGRPSLRLTYDRGHLEVMTISGEHESFARFLNRLVIALTEEMGLPVREGGSTTFRRRRRRRGLDPDNCYWITHEPQVRGRLNIDLRIDPPPDLAIEIDITHSSLDRLAVYAALGVPEVWRFDGQVLMFHLLGADGRYAAASPSRVFPGLKPEDVLHFLTLRGQADDNAVVRQFRAWVQSRIGAGWQ
jgi:Uma2 family endonuclease